MEYCCKELSQAVKNDVVIFISGIRKYESYPDIFSIRGVPAMDDDGDGHFDDRTETVNISFCPFCGERFKERIAVDCLCFI